MNVYDFDNTIYDGESTIDFFCFCLKERKKLCLYIPIVTYFALLYKLRLLSLDKVCKLANKMSSIAMENKEEAETLIRSFWDKNEYKLKEYFLQKINPDDVIITASPRPLIDGVESKLKTKNIICTEFNLETGKLEFICFRENKAKAFKKCFPDTVIDEFYTDSLNDIALMNLADKSYIVKKKTKIREFHK